MMARAALVIAVLALVAGGAGLAYGISARHGEAAMSRQLSSTSRQVGRLRAEVAAVSAKATGARRDLVTCGDLAVVLNGPPGASYEGLNQVLGDYTTATGIAVQLPSHCLNG